MTSRPTLRTPPPLLSEAWWPLDGVAPTDSRWHADHVESGWWDPGDLHRTRLRHATALVDELLASLPQRAVAEGATVLELGCGPGTGLQELAARWPCELHAWDASEQARTHAPLMARAKVHDVPAPPLPPADGSVDVVWAPRCFARGALDWAELLAESHRLLAPGGLLAAVLGGSGAWAWEEEQGPWEEETTGMLLTGLGRPDERGGPVCFTSRWWLDEHWGRGFEPVVVRPAGALMAHPGKGFGLAVWRRRGGEPVPAAAFAALAPGDRREGRAIRRQLDLARAEARREAERRAGALTAAHSRAEALARPDAVQEHPGVRHALAAVQGLEQEAGR